MPISTENHGVYKHVQKTEIPVYIHVANSARRAHLRVKAFPVRFRFDLALANCPTPPPTPLACLQYIIRIRAFMFWEFGRFFHRRSS